MIRFPSIKPLLYFILARIILKENMQHSELPSLFLYVQMSFYCPYLATATSASVLPHSGHDWAIKVVFVTTLVPETSYLRDHMWYLASCFLPLCRTMQKRRRILPYFVSAVPLVHKGIGERSVSLPRKMQCNGEIKARLTTSRLYDTLYAREFAMKLPTPPPPHNTPAEAGWGAQGVFGVSKGLGPSPAWCSCSALGCGEQRA